MAKAQEFIKNVQVVVMDLIEICSIFKTLDAKARERHATQFEEALSGYINLLSQNLKAAKKQIRDAELIHEVDRLLTNMSEVSLDEGQQDQGLSLALKPLIVILANCIVDQKIRKSSGPWVNQQQFLLAMLGIIMEKLNVPDLQQNRATAMMCIICLKPETDGVPKTLEEVGIGSTAPVIRRFGEPVDSFKEAHKALVPKPFKQMLDRRSEWKSARTIWPDDGVERNAISFKPQTEVIYGGCPRCRRFYNCVWVHIAQEFKKVLPDIYCAESYALAYRWDDGRSFCDDCD